MMDLTDRHARFLLRLISRHALLYTEMVTAEALLHGDTERLLRYRTEEHPVALQLGGSDPKKLALCTRMANECGFDEVNLNVGCPSDRVQSGRFGACLMLEPNLVAHCYQAMSEVSDVPITIKCRIGVDEQNPANALPEFVQILADAGCTSFSVHARKAWLKGLSPKENREVPPLDYALVHSLKDRFPNLTLVINGGIQSLSESIDHLQHMDGVMLGRKAYYEPYILAEVDSLIFEDRQELPPSREQIFDNYLTYVEEELNKGAALKHMSRHVLGLYHGVAGAKQFRRYISENAYKSDADLRVLMQARELLKPA